MKFLFNTAFAASLALGVAAKSKESHDADIAVEDFAYWRDLVDAVDSFPSTESPTTSNFPTPSPTVEATSCMTIGM